MQSGEAADLRELGARDQIGQLRAQAHPATARSRSTPAGNDWSATFLPVANAVACLRQQRHSRRRVAMKGGVSDFHKLRSQIGEARHLFYVEHFEPSGARMLASACKLILEGAESKRIDARYRSGRGAKFKMRRLVARSLQA